MKEDPVSTYVAEVEGKLKTGQAREHAYRPAFESLVHALCPSLKILNDPSRSEHGNLDFVFLCGDITAGYAETKDIGIDLDKTEKSEQMERYLGYSNLILTDYLEFRFFRNGMRYGEPIRIGTVEGGTLTAKPEAFVELADAIEDFLEGKMPPIYNKNHDGWNTLKKVLDGRASPQSVYFHKREVWFCSIGHNIGFEEDGKGSDYARPVVVMKRCGANLFVGIPLTSQIKPVKYYFGIGMVKGRAAMAMIAQIRLFSSKRLINKMDTISPPIFLALKKAAKNFIF